MKFEDITLSDLNFVIGAVDFLVYPHNIDTIATIIDTVAMNAQQQDGFNYKYLQNCVNRWRKEIEVCD